MSIIKVGVGIILKKNKVLIAKRSKNVPFVGFWEFPGGKIEKNETSENGLHRELMEELNVKSIIKEKFEDFIFQYNDKKYRLECFITEIDDSTLKLSVHDEIKWINIEDGNKYKLLKSNYFILDKLKVYLK